MRDAITSPHSDVSNKLVLLLSGSVFAVATGFGAAAWAKLDKVGDVAASTNALVTAQDARIRRIETYVDMHR